ncbi:MAG: hypothetical protein GWP08_00560 [Nitrospiraceae bacterium]|nr:hypothetical protein [Nitrospiraceae bacterium]
MTSTRDKVSTAVLMGTVVVALVGCPGIPFPIGGTYDQGFDEGFAKDDEYWLGYDDCDATEDDDPIYYSGGDIPDVASPEYDRGYWDGVWYAYNDGYFVCYDYAFTIGFSEGYDAAFYPGFLDFLATDFHVEYDNGGWGDGYNDGFSEGRIFGAADYEAGWPLDWLDALLDYRSGTDLYFDEVDLGTGEFGPVYLYEYGTDPLSFKSATAPRATGPVPAVRKGAAKADAPAISYRTLTAGRQADLDVTPVSVARNGRAPTLATSWLDRVNAYLGATKSATAKSGQKNRRARAATD